MIINEYMRECKILAHLTIKSPFKRDNLLPLINIKEESLKKGYLPPEVLAIILTYIPYKNGLNISLSCKHLFLIHRREMIEQLLPVINKSHAIIRDGYLHIIPRYAICNVKDIDVNKLDDYATEKSVVFDVNEKNKSHLLTVKNLGAIPEKIDAVIKELPKKRPKEKSNEKQIFRFNMDI